MGWSLVLIHCLKFTNYFMLKQKGASPQESKGSIFLRVWDVDLNIKVSPVKFKGNEFHTGELCQSWQMQEVGMGNEGKKGIRKIGKTSEGEKGVGT